MTEISKQGELVGTFSERLKQAREAKGFNQSELAREVWGTTEDSRGYQVARNRDRVSAYEAGRAKPSRDNLVALAAALGVEVDELAPDVLSSEAFAEPTPAVELRIVEGGTFIKVNTKVPADVALEIFAILEKAGVT